MSEKLEDQKLFEFYGGNIRYETDRDGSERNEEKRAEMIDEVHGMQENRCRRWNEMIKINPYRPGEGLMPSYPAGRDEDIENIENLFDALLMNIPTHDIFS